MSQNIRWYVLIILGFVIWGTQHPLIKILSSDVSPFLLNFLRFFIALIVLLPFVIKQKIIPSKKDMLIISSLGIIGISFYGLFVVLGIRLSTAMNSSVLINANPLLIAILAPLLIKERLNWKKNLGIMFGFFGVLLIILNGVNFFNMFNSKYFVGNILLFVSALCVAIYSIYSKKYIKKYGGLVTTFYAVLGGTIVLFLFSIFSGEITQIGNVSFNSYLLIIYVAVITTALTWVIWFNTIKKIGVIKTSIFFFLIPVSGIISSYFILNEELTIFTIIGALLILFGIYIVQKN